jgi:Tol biopolymer transport system component
MTITARTPTPPPDLTGTAINQIMAQIQQTQTALAFTPSLTPTLVPTITPTRDLTGTAVMQVLADLAATQTALVASPTPIRTATRRAAQEFIYFISNGDYDNEQEDAEVYRVNPDGTGRQMLIDPLGSADVIWLSPDDRHIVVAVCPANCTDDSFDVALELYTIDGSFVTTFSPATRYNRNVRWSPDSRYIVYTTSRYTAGDADLYTDAELAIYDRQTGDTRRITNNDQGDFHATWSPDGRRLALVRCESDGDACNLHIINLIDADGEINGVLSSQVLLFQDAAYYNLRWSPDGERIYFIANRDRAGYALYYVTVATEGVTRIVNGGRSDEAGIRTFEVSPDGSRIALVSYSDADDIDTRSIYIYTIDDESLTRVPMDVSYKNYPSWSPNSRSIVFVRRSSAGRDDLYIYNTQTNALRQLTDTEPDESYPVWR